MALCGLYEAPLAMRTAWNAFNGLAMLRLPFERQRVSSVDYCISSLWCSLDTPLDPGKELRKNEFVNKVGNGPHPLADSLSLICGPDHNVGSWLITLKSRKELWILADCIQAIREWLRGHCVCSWKYGWKYGT